MGSQSAKQQERLAGRIAQARQQLLHGTISLAQAGLVLTEVTNELVTGDLGLNEDDHADILNRLRMLTAELEDLQDEQNQERLEKEHRERSTKDAASQLEKGRKTANLVAIYSQEYGKGSPVADLLEAGRNGGGYRIPDERIKLGPICDEVHRIACKGGGFSSHTSTSNGLVNRIREQTAIVVGYAFEAGYNIQDEGVILAMAILGREIAYTLDSDSGARDYKKEHMPRGMSYNMDTRVPGLEPGALDGGFSTDPTVILASHRQALITLGLQLDRAVGERRTKLLAEIDRIKREIKELESQGYQ